MMKIHTLYPDSGLKWDGCRSPNATQKEMFDRDFLMPIWTDDLAMALSNSDPTHLLDKARIILDGVLAAGLVPNLKPGKT